MSQDEIYISASEFHEYAAAFERYHAVFYRFWIMGKPIFRDDIPTAQVTFDNDGQYISFEFNPEFWRKCSFNKRLFVIAHESLHLIHNHGIRGINLKDKIAANIAADIVVNHTLITKFGFKRNEIDFENKYCWIDTVFDDPSTVEENKSFEYYYNLLEQQRSGMSGSEKSKGSNPSLVDDHNFKDMNDIVDFLNKNLSESDKEFVREYVKENKLDTDTDTPGGKRAGTGKGKNHWIFKCEKYIPPKKKWETIVRDWVRKKIRLVDREEDQWIMRNRRHMLLPDDLLLPGEYNIEVVDKKKDAIDVYFFLDTSGSCWGLKDRFFRAARTLPKEHFNVHLFCFDTDVYRTTLVSGNIYGGGGTEFDILETHIQNDLKTGKILKLDAVFIITDGHGGNVNPQEPEKWHWFLSTGGSTRYIPKRSHVFMLNDFE